MSGFSKRVELPRSTQRMLVRGPFVPEEITGLGNIVLMLIWFSFGFNLDTALIVRDHYFLKLASLFS